MTIRVLLAAIMKGTVLICCFLSLLLSQATAGKVFLVRRYAARFCVLRCGNDIYLCAKAADVWKWWSGDSLGGWFVAAYTC